MGAQVHEKEASFEHVSIPRALGEPADGGHHRRHRHMASGSSRPIEQPSKVPTAITFSSSGLLLTYHAGVALTLHANMSEPFPHIIGVSGGAVVGLLLCVAPELLRTAIEFMVSREWARDLTWADVWDPAARVLPEFLHRILPLDAFARAAGRLHVHVTRCDTREGRIISEWTSNEELIRTVQASCSFAMGGVRLSDGCCYWDGGMAKDGALLPTMPGAETVTVAPVSGVGASIEPPTTRWSVPTRYGDISLANLVRAWDVSVPRASSVMAAHVAAGERDARAWLERNMVVP